MKIIKINGILFATLLLLISNAIFAKSPPHEPSRSKIIKYSEKIVADSYYFKPRIMEAGIDPDQINCNSTNWWMDRLKDEADLAARLLKDKLYDQKILKDQNELEEAQKTIARHMMSWIVRTGLILRESHNFGAIVLKDHFWTDDNGILHPLIVFRSAYTADPDLETSCFRSLLEKAAVKHVVNIYGDDFIFVSDLDVREKQAAKNAGVTYALTDKMGYGPWRHTIAKHPESGPVRDKVMKDVARLINEQILKPGGQPPQGNILIHCGGGMHRTGMIIGILQKVINNRPMNEIAAEYRYHVSYKDESRPGGFEQGNLDFVKEFDSSLIKIPQNRIVQ